MMHTRWDKAKARQLYDQETLSLAQIAAAVGIKRAALQSHLRRHKWPVRGNEPEALSSARTTPKPPVVRAARKLRRGETTLPALGSLKEP